MPVATAVTCPQKRAVLQPHRVVRYINPPAITCFAEEAFWLLGICCIGGDDIEEGLLLVLHLIEQLLGVRCEGEADHEAVFRNVGIQRNLHRLWRLRGDIHNPERDERICHPGLWVKPRLKRLRLWEVVGERDGLDRRFIEAEVGNVAAIRAPAIAPAAPATIDFFIVDPVEDAIEDGG